jgi:hypothetical protein
MGKYTILGTFLRRWAVRNDGQEVELTLAQIEGLIGAPLPKAAADIAWWSDDLSGVQSRAWLEAGFEAKLIDDADLVIFVRCEHRSRSKTLAPASPCGGCGITDKKSRALERRGEWDDD